MQLTGHKTEAVYRRYAIVAEGDIREAGAKLAATLGLAAATASLSDNTGGAWVTAQGSGGLAGSTSQPVTARPTCSTTASVIPSDAKHSES